MTIIQTDYNEYDLDLSKQPAIPISSYSEPRKLTFVYPTGIMFKKIVVGPVMMMMLDDGNGSPLAFSYVTENETSLFGFDPRAIVGRVLTEIEVPEIAKGKSGIAIEYMCHVASWWFQYVNAPMKEWIIEAGKAGWLSLQLKRFQKFVKSEESVFIPESMCESPVELAFYRAAIMNNWYSLDPQVIVERFRLDFADVNSRFAIEIDGHDFHKTKQQRTRDAKRQRWFERNGWNMCRFTGSEVHKDPSKCVKEAIEIMKSKST